MLDRVYASGWIGSTSGAGQVIWHLHSDIEVLCLSLRETIDARDIVGNTEVLRENTRVA